MYIHYTEYIVHVMYVAMGIGLESLFFRTYQETSNSASDQTRRGQ